MAPASLAPAGSAPAASSGTAPSAMAPASVAAAPGRAGGLDPAATATAVSGLGILVLSGGLVLRRRAL